MANEPRDPQAEAILVARNSPLRKVTDLRGKTVVLNKGSNVHYLLVKALAAAGLRYTDIHTVYLPPADARVAFERGSADAWVIWDPFYAVEQQATGARLLVDGTGLAPNRQFYLATRAYATAHRNVLTLVVARLKEVDHWALANRDAAARFLAPRMGIDIPSLKLTLQRQVLGPTLTDRAVIADQQSIADAFFHLGLIPHRLRVAEATWSPTN